MVSEDYKKRVHALIKQAKEKKLVKTYEEFSHTQLAQTTALTEEEVKYYISKNKQSSYDIGDIVFVRNYIYKSGEKGINHFFVIIDEEQAIDFNYFGFLISSNLNKTSFPYNVLLKRNNINGLSKDSIVKCDDFIQLDNKEILFKIGNVTEKDLTIFIDTYSKYLNNI